MFPSVELVVNKVGKLGGTGKIASVTLEKINNFIFYSDNPAIFNLRKTIHDSFF